VGFAALNCFDRTVDGPEPFQPSAELVLVHSGIFVDSLLTLRRRGQPRILDKARTQDFWHVLCEHGRAKPSCHCPDVQDIVDPAPHQLRRGTSRAKYLVVLRSKTSHPSYATAVPAGPARAVIASTRNAKQHPIASRQFEAEECAVRVDRQPAQRRSSFLRCDAGEAIQRLPVELVPTWWQFGKVAFQYAINSLLIARSSYFELDLSRLLLS
jgi:hypothetical protein